MTACPDCGLADRGRWRTDCLWRDPPGSIGADPPCYDEEFERRVREREERELRGISHGLLAIGAVALLIVLVLVLI